MLSLWAEVLSVYPSLGIRVHNHCMRVETDAGVRLRRVLEQAPALRRGPRRAAEPEGTVQLSPEPGAPPGELDELLSVAEEPTPKIRRVGPQHLQGLAILAVVVLVFVAMHLLRARPSQVPLQAPSLPAASASAPAGARAPAAAVPSSRPSSTVVKVHVVGEVRRPGVVTLREGARIQDAIDAAGGFTAKAKPGLLNLASPVTDGMQVVVAGPGATSTVNPPSLPSAASTAGTNAGQGTNPGQAAGGGSGTDEPASGDLVNLNTATQAQLETLPGVGPVMAGKILAWRQEHGQFTRVEELQEVSGVGAKTFERLKPLVTV